MVDGNFKCTSTRRSFDMTHFKILACGPCGGKGKRKITGGFCESCEFCGGNGARFKCNQRDCFEFGCSFGVCHVPDSIAHQNGFPLNRHGQRKQE